MPKRKTSARRPRSKKGEIPNICCHKPNNSAYMVVGGQRFYLGKHGSAESVRNQLELWERYQNTGYLPGQKNEPVAVATLLLHFLEHAKKRYQKHGRSTGTYEKYLLIRDLLKDFYRTAVVDFGPGALSAIRDNMIESKKLCRKTINERICQVVKIFKWGVSKELAPTETYIALSTVEPLEKGNPTTFEHPPVPEAPLEDVLKTIAAAHKVIGDMIRIQLYSAMRPQEVYMMRACDIDTSDDIWIYRPHEHKLEHKGKRRIIPLCPESQAILASYLMDNEDTPAAYLFSPAAAMKMRAIESRQNRKTKVQPSQQNRGKGVKKFANRYNKDSYPPRRYKGSGGGRGCAVEPKSITAHNGDRR